jgi:alanine dehydrogenase
MKVGVPKEIKNSESRVGIIPSTVKELVDHGHQVIIETGAGHGSYISDDDFRVAGAQIADQPQHVWAADLVVKVKEPLPEEYLYLRPELILFTFLHLASNPKLTDALLTSGTTGIAYETVQNQTGRLPLLMPMSEIAGRMATQVGAYYLQKSEGGRGLLIGGVPGVMPANVVVLGGGSVGGNAAKIAVGMGANVILLDTCHDKLVYYDDLFQGRLRTLKSNSYNIEEVIKTADLLIGAVLIPGGRAPWLVTKAMLKLMRPGSVIVDVAVDQGGCIETSKPTTHSQPTFVVDDILHYCVANMPGAVPRTSTFALNNQTADYVLALADLGLSALNNKLDLLSGLNTYRGWITHPELAHSLAKNYKNPKELLDSV